MKRVMVEIPPVPRAGKGWAKLVEAVPEDAETGHDWQGVWLVKGTTVDLPIGAVVVDHDENRRGPSWRLSVVMPDGELAWADSSDSRGWAQELRAKARELLAFDSPEARVRVEAGRTIARCESALEDAHDAERIRLRDERESAREWLAAIDVDTVPSPDPERGVAIARCREIMLRHGITVADLGGVP